MTSVKAMSSTLSCHAIVSCWWCHNCSQIAASAMQLVILTLEKEVLGHWWLSALKGHAEVDLHTVPGYDPPPFDPSVYRM